MPPLRLEQVGTLSAPHIDTHTVWSGNPIFFQSYIILGAPLPHPFCSVMVSPEQ